MAHFLKSDAYSFEPHPMFDGVKIAKLAGKEQNSPAGISMLRIEPGVEIPVHTHDESMDSIFVMSGEGEIFADGNWNSVTEGDYCLAPAGEEHGVKNTGSEVLQLFICHAPPLF